MTTLRSGGRILAAGAATFAVYVLTHPRGDVDAANNVDEAVHTMAVESAWVPSHIIGLAATVLIAAGLWTLLRSDWLSDDQRARRAALLLLGGTVGAAIELVPHIFVAAETEELAAQGSTPLTDLHLIFQATLLPIYGVAVAALAIIGFGRVAHPLACVLGVIGGAALAAVGPLLLITDDPRLGFIFMPAGGTFLFLFAAGARAARSKVDHPSLATT